MKLEDIMRRTIPPAPWAEGDTIPWSDPDFSRRMLAEHFSQEHDAASRRTETIDAHAEWIHAELLAAQPSRVLDLGCGPGLYMERLARRGHTLTGVDYSPASVAHARKTAERGGLPITVIEGDMRKTEFGGPYELAMLIAGELNVFRPEEAQDIVRRAAEGLVPRAPRTVSHRGFDVRVDAARRSLSSALVRDGIGPLVGRSACGARRVVLG